MTFGYGVVVEQLGKRRAEGVILTRPTTRKPALSLPEGIRHCLYTGIALAHTQLLLRL